MGWGAVSGSEAWLLMQAEFWTVPSLESRVPSLAGWGKGAALIGARIYSGFSFSMTLLNP